MQKMSTWVQMNIASQSFQIFFGDGRIKVAHCHQKERKKALEYSRNN
jgi:hypothetical protein